MLSMHITNKRFYDNNPKFAQMCKNEYFVMRQHSDIIDNNIFDQLAFVGTDCINDVLENENKLLKFKNDLIEKKYFQLFLSREEYEANKDNFNNTEEGYNYKVVDNYNLVFRGFIKTRNFHILANSTLDTFEVFVLINNSSGKYFCNNSNKKIEFYGFINIGHLVSILPYSLYDIMDFETLHGFTVNSVIKNYLLGASCIKIDNKLFPVDLKSASDNLKIPCNFTTKLVNNFKIIKRLKENPTDPSIIKENNTFIKNITNGFLYLGMKDILLLPNKSYKYCYKYYLLLNYNDKSNAFTFTVWELQIINNNIAKLMDIYSEINKDKSLEELEEMGKDIDPNDPTGIIYTMKCVYEPDY